MFYVIDYFIENNSWLDFFILLLLGSGPTLIWLLICLEFDRSSPEPKKEIFKIFLWGCFMVLLLIPLTGYLNKVVKNINWNSLLITIFILSFLVDGLIEEISKYFILRFRVYKSSHFDELRDGFIYGMILGLGFAFVENIFYAFLEPDLITRASTLILRGFTSTFMHFLSGGIIGYYLALYKFKGKKKFIFQGILLAVLFHGFYNSIIRFDWWWSLFPLALLLIITYLIIFRKIKTFK